MNEAGASVTPRPQAQEVSPVPRGVYPRPSLTARFWSKVDKQGPLPAYAPHLGRCWLWTASKTGAGYGHFWDGKRLVYAHRWLYEQKRGLIPDGFEPDHLCRVRACVNDDHIEAVTHQENVLRGAGVASANAKKTHCSQGHPYDEANTYLVGGGRHRMCRECNRKKQRRQYAKRVASRA